MTETATDRMDTSSGLIIGEGTGNNSFVLMSSKPPTGLQMKKKSDKRYFNIKI